MGIYGASSYYFHNSATLVGEESALYGAEQAVPFEWCTSMLQRLGEAKRPHSGTSLARLISHSFRAILLRVASHFANDLHAALSQYIGDFESFLVWSFGVCSFVSPCPLLL